MPQDTDSPSDRQWIKFHPLTPDEEALQNKLEAQAAKYDAVIMEGKPYSHPAVPGPYGYQLPEGADYTVTDMGPPLVRIVGDKNELQCAYLSRIDEGPARGGGVIFMGRGAAGDPDLVDFTLAHEHAHRFTRDENQADLIASHLIGPQKVIDGLEKFGQEAALQGSVTNLMPGAPVREAIIKATEGTGIDPEKILDQADWHDSIRERQLNIVRAFPDQNLEIIKPVPSALPESLNTAQADKLVADYAAGQSLETARAAEAGFVNLPDALKPATPVPDSPALNTGFNPKNPSFSLN